MAGICGSVVVLENEPLLKGFDRAMAAMAHRGADGRSKLAWDTCVFGHLHTDVGALSLSGPQPIQEKHLLLVADARIDNRAELAQTLGLPPNTFSDAALILAAYQRWGSACASHLLGEFAIALWDQRLRQLHCWTDHFGQRHLYYYQAGTRLIFASETLALLCFEGVPKKLNEKSMGEFLMVSTSPDPHQTFFEGIYKVPAATHLCFDGRTVKLSTYWELPWAEQNWGDSTQVLEKLTFLLDTAIRRRVTPTYPAGIALSGGLDSSYLAAKSQAVLREQGQSLHAFTIVEPDWATHEMTHRHYTEMLRQHVPGLNIHYIEGTAESLLQGSDLFARLGKPVGPTSIRFNEMFQRARNLGCRTFLSGFGGDETISPRGAGFLASLARSGKFGLLIDELRARAKHTGRPLHAIIRAEIIKPLLPEPLWNALTYLKPSLRLRPWVCNADYLKESGLPLGPPRRRYLPSVRENCHHGLKALANGQGSEVMSQLASHYGINFTIPFLDKEFVEFVHSLPEEAHVVKGKRRMLIRQLSAGLVPDQLLNRPDGNDHIFPDVHDQMVKMEPQLIAELESMAQQPNLNQRVDFKRVRRFLNNSLKKKGLFGFGGHLFVVRGIGAARYIQWISGENE